MAAIATQGAEAKAGGSPAPAQSKLDLQLLELVSAAAAPPAQAVQQLLDQGAHPYYQDFATGESVLMRAAGNGYEDIVVMLLQHGAPWNAVDRSGRCAGTHALNNSKQSVVNVIVEAGVRAELEFDVAASSSTEPTVPTVINPTTANGESSHVFTERRLKYVGSGSTSALVDDRGAGVMMQWEQPLMEKHAKILCEFSTAEDRRADVLNVGFGMGLIDSAIQQFGARTHTIVEAHPDVYRKMLADGWDKKPGVRILHGRWQEVLLRDDVGPFDSVFFDTFDDVQHMDEFHAQLPRLVRPGGLYSFFNGLCPENIIFQGVACQVIKLKLEKLGFDVDFLPLAVDCADASLWEGTPFRYYFRNDYHLPLCRLSGRAPQELGTKAGSN